MTHPKPTQNFQHGYYARQYSNSWWRRRGDRPLMFNTIIRKLRAHASGRLLDVGCGEGNFLRRSAKHFEAHGIDISEEGVLNATQNSGLDTIRLASATDLPYESATFNVVSCFDVVEHLPEPGAFFTEAHRVLCPKGILFFTTPNPDSLGHRLKGQHSTIYQDPTHVSVLSPDDWRSYLREHGFRIVHDGTDTLWDPPYLPLMPNKLQRILFLAISHLMWAFEVAYPWKLGENYICLAQKT